MNLYLKVIGRRPDGYHELVTVMQPLTLADVLEVEGGGGGLTFSCEGGGVPQGPENLVWRAAASFFAALGEPPRAHLALTKQIPVAAGLGGGSSDAAATLLALNELWDTPLQLPDLHRLAAGLGADVPFFLTPGPKLGRGIGTDLTPLALPAYWYVLLNPGLAISTRWVYQNLDLPALQRKGAALRQIWEGAFPERWVANDLETVTLAQHPELKELLGLLTRQGAKAAGMSGSGPTLFGLFPDQQAALTAATALRAACAGWLAVARGLTLEEPLSGWEDEVWMI